MFAVKEPILTEKSFAKIKDRVYLFKVKPGASKGRIKSEVEFIFNVKVRRVNTLKDPLRRRRVGRFSGFRSRFKRAFVFLEEGYSISIYPKEQESSSKEAANRSAASQLEESGQLASSKRPAGGELTLEPESGEELTPQEEV